MCVYDAERTQPVPNATCHLLRRRGYGTPGRKTRATQGDARAVCVVFAACYKANTLSLLCWSFVDQQSLSFFACVYLRRVLFGCISSRFESWRFFWLKSWWIELHSRKWLFPVCNKKNRKRDRLAQFTSGGTRHNLQKNLAVPGKKADELVFSIVSRAPSKYTRGRR